MPKSRSKTSATKRTAKSTASKAKRDEAVQKLSKFITDGKAGDSTQELTTIKDDLGSVT